MLVAGSDERGRAAADDAELIAAVFAENGATEVFSTDDPDEGEAFVAARRFCIPAVEAKGSLLLEDVGVPLPALGALVSGIARIAAERDLMISVIAHAGDGNTHPLIVYDPADAAMAERAHLAFGEIMDLAVGLGGTITGEHGVGRLKRPWLAGYLGPDVMELNQRIKQRVGPAGHPEPRRGDLGGRCGCTAVECALAALCVIPCAEREIRARFPPISRPENTLGARRCQGCTLGGEPIDISPLLSYE